MEALRIAALLVVAGVAVGASGCGADETERPGMVVGSGMGPNSQAGLGHPGGAGGTPGNGGGGGDSGVPLPGADAGVSQPPDSGVPACAEGECDSPCGPTEYCALCSNSVGELQPICVPCFSVCLDAPLPPRL